MAGRNPWEEGGHYMGQPDGQSSSAWRRRQVGRVPASPPAAPAATSGTTAGEGRPVVTEEQIRQAVEGDADGPWDFLTTMAALGPTQTD